MAKWTRGLWHKHHWQPEDDLLAEFDLMEYNYVNDDYETGSEMFQRILSADGSANKKRNDNTETEVEHIEGWRYNPLPQREEEQDVL